MKFPHPLDIVNSLNDARASLQGNNRIGESTSNFDWDTNTIMTQLRESWKNGSQLFQKTAPPLETIHKVDNAAVGQKPSESLSEVERFGPGSGFTFQSRNLQIKSADKDALFKGNCNSKLLLAVSQSKLVLKKKVRSSTRNIRQYSHAKRTTKSKIITLKYSGGFQDYHRCKTHNSNFPLNHTDVFNQNSLTMCNMREQLGTVHTDTFNQQILEPYITKNGSNPSIGWFSRDKNEKTVNKSKEWIQMSKGGTTLWPPTTSPFFQPCLTIAPSLLVDKLNCFQNTEDEQWKELGHTTLLPMLMLNRNFISNENEEYYTMHATPKFPFMDPYHRANAEKTSKSDKLEELKVRRASILFSEFDLEGLNEREMRATTQKKTINRKSKHNDRSLHGNMHSTFGVTGSSSKGTTEANANESILNYLNQLRSSDESIGPALFKNPSLIDPKLELPGLPYTFQTRKVVQSAKRRAIVKKLFRKKSMKTLSNQFVSTLKPYQYRLMEVLLEPYVGKSEDEMLQVFLGEQELRLRFSGK